MTKNAFHAAARKILLQTSFIAGFVGLAGMASVASAAELVKEFTGTGSKTTTEFEVQAPWIIDWRTRGDYPGSMGFELTLESAPGGAYQGTVATTKWVDNGVKLFNEGGRYRLRVESNITDWTVRVEQLTKAEAEEYTVKERPKRAD